MCLLFKTLLDLQETTEQQDLVLATDTWATMLIILTLQVDQGIGAVHQIRKQVVTLVEMLLDG